VRTIKPSAYRPGQKFNLLTMKELRMERSRRYWVCDCECGGQTRPLREDRVVNGVVKSCGCLLALRGKDRHSWKGCGAVSGHFFCFARHQAKYRNIPFRLTIEQMATLFEAQRGRCALTGLHLQFSSQDSRRKGTPQTASLDRIDSSLGYVEGNVWWVHKDVNRIKRELPLERFLELCRLVAAHAAHGRSAS
jgi:hypothetical protein